MKIAIDKAKAELKKEVLNIPLSEKVKY